MKRIRLKGLLMVVTAASLWGLSGTAAQSLFQAGNISSEWLVTVRLLISGTVLILLGRIFIGPGVWQVWKGRKERRQMLIFGVFGMLGVQYTYFASIETGNAAIATLLQYLAPGMIILYFLLKDQIRPLRFEWIALAMALLGTFLLLTNGSFEQLAVPFISIAWGLLSAVTLAFYTLYGAMLLKKWESAIVVGWGMAVGGLSMSLITHPWKLPQIAWSVKVYAEIAFVIIFGTLTAFFLYLESLKYISAKEASLLGCTEPLVAVLASVIWLKVPFGTIQAAGTLLIIGMIVLLSLKKKTARIPVKRSN